MTDEVFSDNLDEASKADTEAAAAVEALPAEGEADQAVAADQATDEQAQSRAGRSRKSRPRKPLRMKTLSRMPVPRPSRNSPRACARLKASGMCCTPIPAMRSA